MQGAGLGWLLAAHGLRRARRRSVLLLRLVRASSERADLLALNAAILATQPHQGVKALEAIAAGAKELAEDLRSSSSASESSVV